MFSLMMIALVVGGLGGAAIASARNARFRRLALIVWCGLPFVSALVVVVSLGLTSGEALATWPLLWVGMLIGVPSILFALGAGLGFLGGRRAQSGRGDQG